MRTLAWLSCAFWAAFTAAYAYSARDTPILWLAGACSAGALAAAAFGKRS